VAVDNPDDPDGAAPLWRFALIGLVGGFASGMFGVGGGIVMVPLLVLAGRLDQRHASATSLLAIIPTAVAGAAIYGAGGDLAVVPAVIVGCGAVGGSWIGARILRTIRLGALRWAFVALLVAVAGWMAASSPVRAADLAWDARAAAGMVALGVAMGVASALFGIGGGIIAVPGLIGLFGLGDLAARGTSLLIMVPTAITGTLANSRAGLVRPAPGLVAGMAAVFASWGGSTMARLTSPRAGNLLFALLLVVAAVQLARAAWRAGGRGGAGS
jgi:uncharacterized membrane protein YfcA